MAIKGDTLQRFAFSVQERGLTIARVLAVAVLLGGGIYSFLLDDHLPYLDEREYLAIARNVATNGFFSHDGVHPNGHRAPLYPLLLSGFVALGADVSELRVVNFVLLALSLYLLHRTVREHLSPLAGGLTPLLVVGYPVLFYAAGTLFPQTLGAFLFVLSLFLLSKATSTRALVVAGAVFGLLILTIPMFLFTLAVVVVWLLAVKQGARMRSAFAIVVPAALVVSVWTVRNYLVFHAFVLVSTAGGATFLWGNAPESTIGSAQVDFLFRAYDETSGMNPVEVSAYQRELALKAIRENKLHFLGFYLLKVLNHFNFYNEHYAASETSMLKAVIMALTYCPLLALFVLRLAWWKRFRPSHFEALLILLYITAAFYYAIFHTRIRYRLPYDYALIAVVAMFVAQWVSLRLVPSRRRNGSGQLVAGVVGVS